MAGPPSGGLQGALPEWLSRLAELLTVTPDYAFTIDNNGVILWCNEALEALVGRALKGEHVATFRPEWVREVLETEARPAAIRDGYWVGRTAIAVPGQAERPVQQVLVAHRTPAGEVEGYSAVLRDLTDQEALAERYRVLADTVPVGIFQNDEDGQCVWVNAAYCRITGRSVADVLGYRWVSALAPESMRVPEQARAAMTDLTTFGPRDVDFFRADGERRIATLRVAPLVARDGTVHGQIGVLDDITERRLALRALEEAEQRFRVVLSTMQQGIVLQDETGAIRFWNPATERILGLSADELRGTTSVSPRWRAVDEEGRDLPGEQHPAMVVLRTREPVTGFVMGIHRSDDSLVWLRVSSQPTTLPGTVDERAAVTTFVDITAERSAEELLRRSERQLRVITSSARDAICLHDADGIYTWISDGAIEVLGWPPEQLIGRNPYDFFHPDDVERIRHESHEPVLTGGRPMSITFRFRRQDGTYTWIETETAVVPATETTALRLVTTSHSADFRVESDARNLVRQRLGGVAQFAGRLAHDFTNLFTVARARLEMVREQLGGVHTYDLDVAFEAIERATDLTRSLRALSGRDPVHLEACDLGDVVRGLALALENTAGAHIRIELSSDGTALPVHIDRDAIEHSLQAVVKNAAEAMPGVGSLYISTERVRLTESLIERHGEVAAGDWAVIRCRDTGPGIDALHIARVFEPALSSKGSQVETGLGLAVTLARLQQLGGHVSVRNHAAGGAEVVLWIPLSSSAAPSPVAPSPVVPVPVGPPPVAPSPVAPSPGAPSPVAPPPVAPSPPPPVSVGDPARAAHLLLVDDDALVLRTAERLLVRSGFRVTTAGSGFEALDALDAAELAGDPFETIVTDVVMPGLSGPEFVARRRQRGPMCPVVYMSGYTGDSLPAAFVPEVGAELISKPFASATLVAAIRAAMARAVE